VVLCKQASTTVKVHHQPACKPTDMAPPSPHVSPSLPFIFPRKAKCVPFTHRAGSRWAATGRHCTRAVVPRFRRGAPGGGAEEQPRVTASSIACESSHHLFRSLVGPNPVQLHTWLSSYGRVVRPLALAASVAPSQPQLALPNPPANSGADVWREIEFVERDCLACRKNSSSRLSMHEGNKLTA
jgi:hypothetical protein